MIVRDIGVFGEAGATLQRPMSATQQASASLWRGNLTSINQGVGSWAEMGKEDWERGEGGL